MARLIRLISGRWTTHNTRPVDLSKAAATHLCGQQQPQQPQQQQRSRSADRGGLLLCRVSLLDGTDIMVDIPKRSLGGVLYEKVFRHLDLAETEYFGLQFIDEEKVNCWLDSAKSIRRQVPAASVDSVYVFKFRVKFYSSDVNRLKEEITRYQFFLQLKNDLASGRLQCSTELATELAAISLQSELGDFDEREHTLGLVSEFKFFPYQTEDMEIQVLKKFKTYSGWSPARCELSYLNKVKGLELYGVHFCSVIGKDGNNYQLGLTPSGLLLYDSSPKKIGLFGWPKITKLQFKKKKILLELVETDDSGQGQELTFTFRLSTERECKNLWKCAVEHHTFFRLSSSLKPYTLKSGFFHLGSRVRRSGKTELETMNKITDHRNVRFQRKPSKRYSRREKFDKQEKERNDFYGEKAKQLHAKRRSVVGTVDETEKPANGASRQIRSKSTSAISHPHNRPFSVASDQFQSNLRSSMRRSRPPTGADRTYSPFKTIDPDNSNLIKASSSNLIPVQVTVSTQESFDEEIQSRFNNGRPFYGNGHQRPTNVNASLARPPVWTRQGVVNDPSSRSYRSAEPAAAVAAEPENRFREPVSSADNESTYLLNNRHWQQQQQWQRQQQQPPHVPLHYNSMRMPRSGRRQNASGGDGGAGEYDRNPRFQSQRNLSQPMTADRFQQGLWQNEEAYPEDLRRQISSQLALGAIRDPYPPPDRNGGPVAHRYHGNGQFRDLGYAEERSQSYVASNFFHRPLTNRAVHKTNLMTQV